MENRPKMTFKKVSKNLLKILCLLLFFTCFQPVVIYAAPGELIINNEVIYEKNNDGQINTTTFKINQLFLKEMSSQNKLLADEKKKLIITAKKEVFLKETPPQGKLEKKVYPQIFLVGYTLNDSLITVDSSVKQDKSSGYILVYIAAGFLVVSLGIFLGRTFPKWLRK